jgi:hypothetical protein
VSSDPSRVLLATTTSGIGAAAIDVAVANGSTGFLFYTVGSDWTDGVSSSATVTVTATASGFLSDGETIAYVRPAVEIFNMVSSIAAGSINRDFNVRIGIPNQGGVTIGAPQWRRPGAAALQVTVTNSNAAVAELDQNGGLNGAQVQTAFIVAGQSTTPLNAAGGLEFDPIAAGSTRLMPTIPNFTTVPATGFVITITP